MPGGLAMEKQQQHVQGVTGELQRPWCLAIGMGQAGEVYAEE